MVFKQSNWRHNHYIEDGTNLVDRIMKEKKRWDKVMTSTDLTPNSCKAWKTIKNPSNNITTSTPTKLHTNVRGQPNRPVQPTDATGEVGYLLHRK